MPSYVTLCDLCLLSLMRLMSLKSRCVKTVETCFQRVTPLTPVFFCVRFDAVNDFRIEFAVPRALQLQKRAVKTRPSEKKAPTLEICTFYTG